MKDVLADVMKQVASLFENVLVAGTEEQTKVFAQDKDMMFYLVAEAKSVIPEFVGDFGIGDMAMLKGLLEFPSYKTDEAKFIIHRKQLEGSEEVYEFEFRDREGARTKFKTISPRFVGGDGKTLSSKKTSVGNIPWDITVPITKAKVGEIVQLAGLVSAKLDDNLFSLRVENDHLYFTMGGKSEITHAASVSLMDGVTSELLNSNRYEYNITNFLAVIKSAGNSPLTVRFCPRGVIGITIETDLVTYDYYIRGGN